MRAILGWGAVACALASSFAATVEAQQTGEIHGRVTNAASGEGVEGVVVLARGPAVQMDQFGLTEPDGTFTIPLLPPGSYTLEIQMEGFQTRMIRDVDVPLGERRFVGVELVPTAIEGERIVVQAPRTPAIDQGSFELSTNLSRDFIRRAPSGRLYTEVLRETPGAVEDDVGTGVFGATGAENVYVIDGLNTTGVGFGLAESELPVDFFDQIEIKTGGYMPEYGYALGGFYNLLLRSGGNELHGDVFFNVAPGFLRAEADPVGRRGEAIGREDDPLMDLDVGFAIGGPIIRDRLWFFVGYNPRFQLNDVDRIYRRQVDRDGDGNPDEVDGLPVTEEVGREEFNRDRTIAYLAGKVTLGLDPNNRLSLSYFGNPTWTDGVQRAIDDSRSNNGLSGDREYILGERFTDSNNLALSYEGQFLERRLRVEAFVGVHHETYQVGRNGGGPAVEHLYPTALDDFEPGLCMEDPATPFTDCPMREYVQGEIGFDDETLMRYMTGLKLTHAIADHTIRYGANLEVRTYDSTRGYNPYVEERFAPTAADDPYAIDRIYYAQPDPAGGEPTIWNQDGNPPFSAHVSSLALSLFAQDSWEINRYLTVGGGLRWDFEEIRDADGEAIVTLTDQFAPRVGVSVDPTGSGRSRIYASYGWYYEQIPLDFNQRSFSQEGIGIRFADENGNLFCFDDEGNPVPGGSPPDCTYDPFGVLGGENSPVVNDLGGQYHDETVLGGEYDLGGGWVVGASGVMRRLLRGIEDISPDDGNNYFIANPGVNDCNVPEQYREPLLETCGVDRNGDGTITPDEYDPNRTVFPEPERDFYGLILTVRKKFSDHVQVLASYTLSRTEGNYTGLYAADNEQLDPNITSQYDLVSLLENRHGPLPNDRTHQIKISGAYELGGVTPSLSGLTVGLRYEGVSGTPINYLGRHEVYGRREAFILPRGEAGRTPWLHQVDAYVGYDIPMSRDVKLNLNLTVFNLFNFQEAVTVDQEYTTDVVTPAAPGTPIESVTNADGEPLNVNPTFGEPRRLQLPLFVRLGARLTF